MAIPTDLLMPGRMPKGLSAILLPFHVDGSTDLASLRAHVARTAEHGLVPAVNMDTGFGHLLDDATRREVLTATREILGGGEFVAGAFCRDQPGAAFNLAEYARQIDLIQEFGGTPVIFQSYGLSQQEGPDIVESYEAIATKCDEFIGFELTKDLAPFGSVYDLDTYAGLMGIPQCIGAKHSSFHREPEWQRLRLRNKRRPDFRVFTGNDFGIDMIMYGSDYLLGLSTFAPDLFAKRDRWWANEDARFYELNDQLQYLGFLAFRNPGPAYKHSAAQFLKLRGWIECDDTHPESPQRPGSDVAILSELLTRLTSEHA
ncbi:MAG: dihydrodipicolinate synthase family protein [Planctomycetaceae bacterium]